VKELARRAALALERVAKVAPISSPASSTAGSERCLRPPRASERSRSTASSGPRSRNSIPGRRDRSRVRCGGQRPPLNLDPTGVLPPRLRPPLPRRRRVTRRNHRSRSRPRGEPHEIQRRAPVTGRKRHIVSTGIGNALDRRGLPRPPRRHEPFGANRILDVRRDGDLCAAVLGAAAISAILA
jgi:hypothetical protein